MRWAEALKQSKISQIERKLINIDDAAEPNILLLDSKFSESTPKAFHATESVAWIRVKLKFADNYDDWEPCQTHNNFEATS